MAGVWACGRRPGWSPRLPPPFHTHPHHHRRISPEQDPGPPVPAALGADPSEVAAVGALLTSAEVGEDVMLPEVGSGRTRPGVAVAEAAAAAGWAVGLQAKCARATSAMEVDMPTGAR